MIVSVQWQGAPPSRYFFFSSAVILSRPSVPTSSRFMPVPPAGRFFMSLNGSIRSIPDSRSVTTAWPMPPAPSTRTESVVATRMPQRGLSSCFFLGRPRLGGAARGRGGRGERCGVGTGGHLRGARGTVRTVGPYDLHPGQRTGGARRCPPFAVTWRPNTAAWWGARPPAPPRTPRGPHVCRAAPRRLRDHAGTQ